MSFVNIRLGCNVRFQFTDGVTDPEERKGRFEGLDFGKPGDNSDPDAPSQWWLTIFDYDRMANRTFPLSAISDIQVV